MDDFQLGTLRRIEGAVSSAERLLQRSQHERQRRAKFVADVAEERRLGAVEFGQRFGALALLLIGAGVGNGRGDLGRDEIKKAVIQLVEAQAHADAGHQQTGGLVRHIRANGHDRGDLGWVRPRSWGDRVAPRSEIVNDLHRFCPHGFGQRPYACRACVPSELNDERTGRGPHGNASRPSEAGALAVRLQQIQQGKGDVMRVLRQGRGGNGTGVLGRFRLRGTCPKVAQNRHATLTNDFVADFVHGGEHPANPARHGLIRHRAVRDREMGLLDKPVPVDFQDEVLHPGRRPAVEGCIDQRLQHVPDLAPACADRLPQRPRVLRAEHRAVGIVVDRDILGAPPQEQRKSVREQKTHHHAEAWRPGGGRANRRLRPVERPYRRAHLATVSEPGRYGRVDLPGKIVFHTLPSMATRTSVSVLWCLL